MPQSQYLSTDPNAGQPMRHGGQSYASMTPDERRAAWQQGEAPLQRTGLPELASEHPYLTAAAFAAATGGRNIIRGAMQNGAPVATRAANVATATASAAAPQIKYEAVKAGLQFAGVPSVIAVPAAMVLSGMRRGVPTPDVTSEVPRPRVDVAGGMASAGRAAQRAVVTEGMARANATPSVSSEPSSPAPSPQAAAAAPASPSTARPSRGGSGLTPPQIASQLDQASRVAKVNLSADQHQAAYRLVRDGSATPAEAVARVTGAQVPATPAPSGSQVSPSEMTEYLRLVKAGKTHEEAVKAIVQMRQLSGKTGAMTPETMQAEIAGRVNNRSPRREP